MISDRFENVSDLEILDNKTGLVWQKDFAIDLTWQEAMDYAVSLGKGWRLPTINELISLIDFERTNPASEFPDMPSSWFWTSSSYASNVSFAWLVYFGDGLVDVDVKIFSNHVRCVRGGAAKEEI